MNTGLLGGFPRRASSIVGPDGFDAHKKPLYLPANSVSLDFDGSDRITTDSLLSFCSLYNGTNVTYSVNDWMPGALVARYSSNAAGWHAFCFPLPASIGTGVDFSLASSVSTANADGNYTIAGVGLSNSASPFAAGAITWHGYIGYNGGIKAIWEWYSGGTYQGALAGFNMQTPHPDGYLRMRRVGTTVSVGYGRSGARRPLVDSGLGDLNFTPTYMVLVFLNQTVLQVADFAWRWARLIYGYGNYDFGG